jgi:cytochrome P450 family 110
MANIPIVEAPPLIQLLRWTFQPLAFLDSCAQRYGDSFIMQLGSSSPQVIVASHPDFIADLFNASNAPLFDSGRTQPLLKWAMGENSALVLDGSTHRRHRQLLMPPFHGERMRDHGQLMCQIAQNVMADWRVGKPVTILPYMNDITLQVILEAVFGLHEGVRYLRLRKLLKQYLDMAASPVLYLIGMIPLLQKDLGEWSPVGRYFKLQREIDELLFAEIADRRQEADSDSGGVLTMLIAARDEDGQPMSDQELRDELLTLLLAGHDSSGATLSWAIYLIHAHPLVKARLQAEIDQLPPDADPMAIARLPYLSAVCSESLRLHPSGPAILTRVTNYPARVYHYDFPENTLILPCVYLTHHRADIYPNPRQFQPDRFLDRQYSPSEYYPFGGNNRRCIASAFALFEMKLVITTLMQRYDLELTEKHPVKAIRRHINLAPKGGVRMKVKNLKSLPTPALLQKVR